MSDLSSTFRRQLAILLDENDVTQSELAARLDVSTSAVNNWLLGNNMPRMDKIDKIASIFNVPRSVLIGDGDKGNTFSRYNLLPIEKHTIPVLGNVHCGTPQYTEQDYLGVVDSNVNADFALIAVGDSMIDAGIYEGDLVFVRRKAVVDNGNLAVVLIGDETAIKKIHKTESTLVLSPANASYEPLVFDQTSGEDIKVLGEVVAFTHYLKSYQSEEDRTLAKDNNLEV